MLSAVSSLLGKRDAPSESDASLPPMHFNMGVDDDDEDEQELKAKKVRLALELKKLEAVEKRCSEDLELPAGFDSEKWGFMMAFEEQQRDVMTLVEWDALSKRIRDRIVYFATKKAIVKKKLAQKKNFSKIEGLRNQAKKQRKSVVGVRDSILEINSQEL